MICVHSPHQLLVSCWLIRNLFPRHVFATIKTIYYKQKINVVRIDGYKLYLQLIEILIYNANKYCAETIQQLFLK